MKALCIVALAAASLSGCGRVAHRTPDGPPVGPPRVLSLEPIQRPASPSYDCFFPRGWSPDSRWLIALEQCPTMSIRHGRLWLMAADGSSARPIGPMDRMGEPQVVAWSSDSQSFTYVVGGDLQRARIGASEPSRLAHLGDYVESWGPLPDGTMWVSVGPAGAKFPCVWQLHDRGGRLIRRQEWPDGRWPSPSGRWWVLNRVTYRPSGDEDFDCAVFDADGHQCARWPGWAFEAWLPREEGVLLRTGHRVVGREPDWESGWTYGVAGLSDLSVSRVTLTDELWEGVHYAPHRRWMVYRQVVKIGGRAECRDWVATADGHNRSALLPAGTAPAQVWPYPWDCAWSPDGRALAVGPGDGRVALWIVRLGEGPTTAAGDQPSAPPAVSSNR